MASSVTLKQYPTVVLSTGDVIKYLNATGNSGTTVSAYDTTNTQFQVPVGKKLICTSMAIISGNVGTVEIRCYHGSTVNSSAGATEWVDDSIRYETGSTSNLMLHIPIYVEVPAGDYLTFNFANEQFTVHVMGVLTDA